MRRIALALAVASLAAASPATAAPACAEDAPCWNWATMGNHQRGWVDPEGNPRVGGPCRFARAIRSHRVFQYQRTQKMRGDVTAMRIAGIRHCI